MRLKHLAGVTIFVIMLLAVNAGGVAAAETYDLAALCTMALQRAEKIAIAAEDVVIAENLRKKAISVLIPTISATGAYRGYSTDKHTSTRVVTQPDYTTTLELSLSKSFSIGGKELITLAMATENIDRSKHLTNAVRESYIHEVIQGYYDLLKARSALTIAESNVHRLTRYQEEAALKLKHGEVTATDLARANAQLASGKTDVITAAGNVNVTKTVLARLAGIEGDFEVVEAPAGTIVALSDPLEALKEQATANRYELKALAITKEIAARDVSAARSAYWPTVSVEGKYQRRADEPAIVSVNKESIYGGVAVTYPIIEGGRRKADVDEALAKEKQATLTYESTRKNIAVDVEKAFLDFKTTSEMLKSIAEQLTYAQENYKSVVRQYEVGIARAIDVVDANNLLVNTELSLSNATYDHHLSTYALKRVTGVLLSYFNNATNSDSVKE